MPAHYNIWQWGPNDPILQEVSCDIDNMYTVIYVIRYTLASPRHGRGIKFFVHTVDMGFIRPRANTFVRCTKHFTVRQRSYLAING